MGENFERRNQNWNEMYELAKIYYSYYGNLKVKPRFKTLNGYEYDNNGKNLGNWIIRQRYAYQNKNLDVAERKKDYGVLTDEQVEKLSKIGMIFGSVHEYQWNKMYDLAKNYYLKYGNLYINYEFKTLNGYEYDEFGEKLGLWIDCQRTKYKYRSIPKEKRTSYYTPLTDEQIEKLLNIGMVFENSRNCHLELEWNKIYELAKSYYEIYGNLEISSNFKTLNGSVYDENGINLGEWITNQRSAYKNTIISKGNRKNNISILTDKQIKKLENIGMIFENIRDYQWNKMYNLAKNYYEYYGDLQVNYEFKTSNGFDYDINGENLGYWIVRQRRAYRNRNIPKEERKNKIFPLTDEQKEKLESIGMLFENVLECRNEQSWNYMYSLAKKYFDYHGNLRISNKFKTLNGYEYNDQGVCLGNWINSQKAAYKNRNILKEERKNLNLPLTDEQVEKLINIGIIFENSLKKRTKKSWDEMYELARNYYDYYKNLNIKIMFKTSNGYEYDEQGLSLGTWISRQRTAYRNRNVSKDKIKNSCHLLTDEQIEKLLNIGMIFDYRGNISENKRLCEIYELGYDEYLINNIANEELNAKINFLLENNIPLIINEQIHEIFFMSNANMKEIYGFSREELIEKYYYKKVNIKIKKM